MPPGPAAAPSSVFPPAGGDGAGLSAEYFAAADLSGTPIVTRTEPGIHYEQGFLGGGPAFASLYGSQLAPTPADAQSVRYAGTFTAPAAGAYTLPLTRSGQAPLSFDGAADASPGPAGPARCPCPG